MDECCTLFKHFILRTLIKLTKRQYFDQIDKLKHKFAVWPITVRAKAKLPCPFLYCPTII